MNKKDESKIEILSGIDDDIIEKNTEKRFSLWSAAFGKKKKNPRWIPILAGAACFCILAAAIWLIPWNSRQVPVYRGMTVSNQNTAIAQTASAEDAPRSLSLSAWDWTVYPKSLSLTPVHVLDKNNGDNGNHNGQHKNEQSQSVETEAETAPNSYSADTLYYAKKNQDVYVTVHIDNPDSFEILSFTLNGEKYSSYMFEAGSDLENLILKVNVGDAEGIVEYTIDAIKYVDGTAIKDVRMEGDRTVRVGVYTDKQPKVTLSNIVEDFNAISFDANLGDELGLLALSEGTVRTLLYEGDTKIGEHTLSLGDNTGLHFDGLALDTEYRCVIEAEYDNLSGEGVQKYVLLEQTFHTPLALRFDTVTSTQSNISFALVWNESYTQQQLTSLSLYQGQTKIRDLDVSTRRVTELLSNTEYRIVATYLNGTEEKSVETTIRTQAKATPTLSISSASAQKTSLSFSLSEIDSDNVGAITKIELLHGNDTPVVADTLDTRSFADLLSNNDYTVRVTYVYNLNDGRGDHTITKTKVIRTQAKATPTLNIIDSSSSTQDSVDFVLTETDTDSVGAISKIELLQNGEVVQTKTAGEALRFEGLPPLREYQLLVYYEYDLNDGKGIQAITATRYQYSGLNRSQGLEVNASGVITGMGSCTDTVLYIDQSIAKDAFAAQHSITNVYIGTGATSIGDDAFEGCSHLSSINIPSSVTEIGDGAFYGCTSMQNVYAESLTSWLNLNISSGIFDYDYDSGYSLYINNQLVTDLIIPDGVTKIGSYAFYNCSSLTSINIPSSVTEFEEGAFYGCSSLTNIVYQGTTQWWHRIYKDSYWDYSTGNYVVECTNGTLTKKEAD